MPFNHISEILRYLNIGKSNLSIKKPRWIRRLGYIPISPAYPQKENRFILKGWGVELRVLGWSNTLKTIIFFGLRK